MFKIETSSEAVNKLLKTIPNFSVHDENSLDSKWNKIVRSIRGCGENLAAHSHISDVQNNTLLIVTDHPGYIQLFQLNNNYIIEGLRRAFPELQIRSLSYKLDDVKQETTHNNLRDPTREELEKAIEMRTEKAEKEYRNKSDSMSISESKAQKKVEIAPEIKNIFDNMEKILLTKKE